MRYGFRFGFALALGLALMAGCSDENGEGGSGGTAGTGGVGGEGGTGGMAATGGEGGSGGSTGQVFPCTEQGIRDAIAEGGGPHTFDCDGPMTVMTEAEIDINTDVILDGEGNLTVDGSDDHMIFWVRAAVELRGLTVTNGRGPLAGAIVNSGTLSLVDSIVTGNTVYFSGCDSGPCFTGSGGGIMNIGTLTLINSTVSRNGATDGVGGGIMNMGTLTLINSSLSGNTAADAGGGIYSADGTLTLTNSTISGNVAEHEWSEGGGIAVNGSSITATNSTVSGNAAGSRGGGIAVVGSFEGMALTFSTISGNSAGQGAAISTRQPAYVKVVSSVIDGDCDPALRTVVLSQPTSRHNIESPGDTCGVEHETDQVNVTAEQLNLGPLADNGGPTMTHALLPGSVAIDVIPEADCVDADGASLTTDQRGEPRPETGGTLCDVGAFELQP